jgi:hypothetical protein
MKFKNQMEAVKWHLENKHKLSSLQAFRLYGITRLSDKIFKLRKSGWDIQSEKIKTKNRYGITCEYFNYFIKKC